MVITMKNKKLIVSQNTKIHQRESLVDKLLFLVQAQYDDEVNLEQYTPTLVYIDSANVAHTEILTAEEELYNDEYLQLRLPLDSHFTYLAGTVSMNLVFTYYDSSTEEKHVLTSDSLEIEVMRLNDFFQYTDESTLSGLTNKIMELQTETDKLLAAAEIVSANQVDDIALDTDTDKLHLTINGRMTGNGQEILVPNLWDKHDGEDEGVIDVDNYDDSGDDSGDDDDTYYQFIDLG